MKRQIPKEIIEKGNSKTEQAYIKFPRKELINVGKNEKEKQVERDIDKILQNIIGETNKKDFLQMHTHPYSSGQKLAALPSKADLSSLNYWSKDNLYSKGEVIAQRDKITGEVQGYTFLLTGKKKQNNKPKKMFGIFDLKDKHYVSDLAKFSRYEYGTIDNPNEGYNKLQNIFKEKNWKLRFVPAKGYYFNKETGSYEKKQGIEKVVASILGISALAFLLFSFPKINAFVIDESIANSSKTFSLISGVLFILLVVFMFFRNLRKK